MLLKSSLPLLSNATASVALVDLRVSEGLRYKAEARSPKPKGGDWHPLIASNSAFEKPSSLKDVIRGPLTARIIRY